MVSEVSTLEEFFERCVITDADSGTKNVPDKANFSRLVEWLHDADSSVVLRACDLIGDLARHEENREPLGSDEALVGSLVKLLHTASPEAVPLLKLTARALGNLCYQHVVNAERFQKAGAVKPLLALLPAGSVDLKRNCCGALANLATMNDDVKTDVARDGVPMVLHVLSEPADSADAFTRMLAVRALATLADLDEAQAQLKNNGGVQKLLAAAMKAFGPADNAAKSGGTEADEDDDDDQDDESRVLLELLNCMLALAGTPLASELAQREAVLFLVSVLDHSLKGDESALKQPISPPSGDDESRDARVLAGEVLILLAENDANRDQLYRAGIVPRLFAAVSALSLPAAVIGYCARVPALLSLSDHNAELMFEENLDFFIENLRSEVPDVQMASVMAIGNLARDDTKCRAMVHTKSIVPLIRPLIAQITNERIQLLALGALRNLSILGDNKRAVASTPGVLADTVRSFAASNAQIRFAAIGAIRVLLNSHDENIDAFLQVSGLVALLELCADEAREIERSLKPPAAAESDSEAPPKPEPRDERVLLEGSRIVARLVEQPKCAALLREDTHGATVLTALRALIKSKFALLQLEGCKALCQLAQDAEWRESRLTKHLEVVDNAAELISSTDANVRLLALTSLLCFAKSPLLKASLATDSLQKRLNGLLTAERDARIEALGRQVLQLVF